MATKIFLSFFLFFSVSMSIFAQTVNKNYTIKGIIIDSSEQGIPYATVSLKKDSVSQIFLKRAAADVDGKFQIEVSIESGSYIIQIEAIGFGVILQPIELAEESKIDAGKLLMQESSTQLNEVQVFAAKPLVTQALDRIGYDVEADPENKTNNVLEMLRKVPSCVSIISRLRIASTKNGLRYSSSGVSFNTTSSTDFGKNEP
ncbi:MAG: carboxypeptidase-like regulatory domain-containing protein [Paludibacter sp.]|nr:carboxypeptidase-like regulatory domain-containing protein [Paludibacter sp.]